MTEKGKQILDLFEKIVPNLSDVEIEKLLAFGEGMAFKVQQEKQSPINQEQKPAQEGGEGEMVIISSLLSFLVSCVTAKMCFTKIDRYIETCMKQMQESVDLVSGRQIEQKFSPSGVGKKYILYYNI